MTDFRKGLILALSAFAWWGGIQPAYFALMSGVPSMEILAHRVAWSAPLCALILLASKNWPRLKEALARPKVLSTLAVTSVLVSVNWLLFIYACGTGRILESSLGYFICPLISVILGMIFLGERLRRLQVVAVLIAAAGTINQAILVGHFPWIALTLGVSFSAYTLLRKTVKIEAVDGLLVETGLLSPLALGYIVYLLITGQSHYLSMGPVITVMFSMAGVITTIPLAVFTAGARLLPLSIVGITQYTAPSLSFLVAIFIFNEPFTTGRFITFGLIWLGLAIFIADSLLAQRRA